MRSAVRLRPEMVTGSICGAVKWRLALVRTSLTCGILPGLEAGGEEGGADSLGAGCSALGAAAPGVARAWERLVVPSGFWMRLAVRSVIWVVPRSRLPRRRERSVPSVRMVLAWRMG